MSIQFWYTSINLKCLQCVYLGRWLQNSLQNKNNFFPKYKTKRVWWPPILCHSVYYHFPYFIWNWGRGIIIYKNHAHFDFDFGKGWDPLICPILLGAFRDHSGGHLNPTSSKHTITASGVKLWDCPSTWLGITENIWMVLRG